MSLTRRHFARGLALAGAASLMPHGTVQAAPDPANRVIPSSGEAIPVVGLGTWITFNVGTDPKLLERSVGVMRALMENGGGMIDSSPMYGSSQDTIGHGLGQLGRRGPFFATDKVWTSGDGASQIETTRAKWGIERFDLLQVHNLLAWERQLPLLLEMKAAGAVRYVGITTSHGRRHGDLARIMETQPIDFVQLTYNVRDRAVEDRLLPLARDRGIGVVVNRPFRRGALIRHTAGAPLPGFAAELRAESWAELMLKFIISHPAVTVAIPATTNAGHMRQNKRAAITPLPDEALRQRIAEAVAAI